MIILRPYSEAPGHLMGLDKSGNYELPTLSTFYVVPSWSIRSGFPDTVSGSNGMIADGSLTITITCLATFNVSSAADRYLQVKKNGSVVGSFTETASGTTVGGTTSAFSVVSGDVITLEAKHDASSSSTRTIVASGTHFYMSDAS